LLGHVARWIKATGDVVSHEMPPQPAASAAAINSRTSRRMGEVWPALGELGGSAIGAALCEYAGRTFLRSACSLQLAP
jgi:hypothetical protein